MRALWHDTTDAERVVSLERQRFFLLFVLIIALTLLSMLLIERRFYGKSQVHTDEEFQVPSPKSPTSEDFGHVTSGTWDSSHSSFRWTSESADLPRIDSPFIVAEI